MKFCTPFTGYRLAEIDFHEKTYPRNMLLAILDEGLFALTYTWPSGNNHASDKDDLPLPLKKALLAVGRVTLAGVNKKMSMTEYVAGLRNQFSGNRMRVMLT